VHVLLGEDGGVVVDHVGAGELLAELDGDGEEEAAEVLRLAVGEELSN
jgi:hypothetical protein